jgi:hypothetical protein
MTEFLINSTILRILSALSILIAFLWVIGVNFLGERLFYHARVSGAKDPSEFPEIKIPINVQELIKRFDQKIKLKVKDVPLDGTSLASFGKYPPFIILSKRLFDRKSNKAEQFNDNDIMACVAHELGHFFSKRHIKWLTQLVISATMPLILGLCNALFYKKSACSVVAIILITLFLALSSASREEEERADSFAITEAKIPVEIYTRSLIKVWKSIKQQIPPETRWRYLSRIIVKLFFNTHPSVECRVLRLHTLYQSDDE